MSTTLLPPAVRGVQLPRLRNVPPYSTTAGDEAIELAARAGLHLDEFQQLILRDGMGERPDGKWSAFEVAVLLARQNGKGGALEARELHGLYLGEERLILHSAHEFKTAQEAFLRVKALIDNTDFLRKKVRTMRTSHGEEGIELLDGSRLRFIARSRSSGRGFTGDTVMADEAQELSRAAMGALLPLLSARPNGQVWYAFTVPDENNDAEHITSVRDRGRAGGARSLAWLEWSPGETMDCLDDRRAWAMANPALGIRITEEAIEREREIQDDDTFARERLSIWPSRSGRATVIDMDLWEERIDPLSEAAGRVVFAIDVNPLRTHASISAAGRREDGMAHVELVQNGVGTGWVVDRMAGLVQKWRPAAVVLDGRGPAASLTPELAKRGVTVTPTTSAEMGQACGDFYDAVVNDRLRTRGEPEVTFALQGAKKRVLGNVWEWDRRDPATDITPLVADTLALFGLNNAPEAPELPDLVVGV